MIEAELASYGGLADRPRMVVLNKIDIPEARELAELVRADLEARGLPVFEVSAVSHEGLRELAFAMAGLVAASSARPPPADGRADRDPAARGRRLGVRGDPDEAPLPGPRHRPERWIRQTDFCNDEAVGYLADRLARLGVEDELSGSARSRATRSASAPRTRVVFDWQPSVEAGPGRVPAGRTAARAEAAARRRDRRQRDAEGTEAGPRRRHAPTCRAWEDRQRRWTKRAGARVGLTASRDAVQQDDRHWDGS